MNDSRDRQRVIIFGAGQLARLMKHYLAETGSVDVIGCVVDDEYVIGSASEGVMSFSEMKDRYPANDVKLCLALGYRKMRAKETVFDRLKSQGYSFINFVGEGVLVAGDLQMGEGNIVMPGATIEPDVVIGDNNLLWSRAQICHNVTIGSHNHLSAGAVVAGDCCIGKLCFFGIQSGTINNIEVADETHLLPGSILYESSREATKYLGNPAKAIGQHASSGIVIERG